MKIRQIVGVGVAFWFFGASYVAHADVVTDWNNIALDAIRTDKTPPPNASRHLAILHISIYDAVNGVKAPHRQNFEQYLVTKHRPHKVSVEAAAVAAAHRVLGALYPAQHVIFDPAYANALAGISNSRAKTKGIAWGEFVADQDLSARAHDGSTAVVTPPTGSGPGAWVPTPPTYAPYLLPQWAFVKPFAMTKPSQFRPPGPPPLTSGKYAADYNEVKAFGSLTSTNRTADQTQIANFWADAGATETPPGHWNSLAQVVATARGNTLEQNARLFALLNIALADAAICAWDAKYTYNFWRPITAIPNGGADGNPATDPDLGWVPLLVTPPFPDYVSGHSTFSAAAAEVLRRFYRTDQIAFTIGCDFLPGVTRSFDSFTAAAGEAANSRIYAGIHFRTASQDGLASGQRIGAFVMRRLLRAKHH